MGDALQQRNRVKELSTTGGENTFRYVPFSERVGNMSVDVFRRVDRKLGQANFDAEYASHFQETLERQLEVNATKQYTNFVADVRPLVQSLPLLLLHKGRVVEMLLAAVAAADYSALAPLLALLGSLARDLLEEFRPFFEQVVARVALLLDPKDPQINEQVFHCIGYQFKFLRKLLVKEVQELYERFYHTLLANSKPYIRRFAAESFSFLLRNCPSSDLSATVAAVFGLLRSVEEGHKEYSSPLGFSVTIVDEVRVDRLMDGVGRVMFEACKGSKHHFHSKTAAILQELFLQLRFAKVGTMGKSAATFEAVFLAMDLMFEHGNRRSCTVLWEGLLGAIAILRDEVVAIAKKLATKSAKGQRAGTKRRRSSRGEGKVETGDLERSEAFVCLLGLIHLACRGTEIQTGSRWAGQADVERELAQGIQQLLAVAREVGSPAYCTKVLSLVGSTAEAAQNRASDEFLDNFLAATMERALDPSLAAGEAVTSVQFGLCSRLTKVGRYFGKRVLLPMLSLCNSQLAEHREATIYSLLQALADDDWDRSAARKVLGLSMQYRVLSKHCVAIGKCAVEALGEDSLCLVWASARLLEFLDVPDKSTRAALEDAFTSFKERADQAEGEERDRILVVLAALAHSLGAYYRTYSAPMLPVHVADVLDVVEENPDCLALLESATGLIEEMENVTSLCEAVEELRESRDQRHLLPLFHKSLSSPNGILRQSSLRFLALFPVGEDEAKDVDGDTDMEGDGATVRRVNVVEYFYNASDVDVHDIKSSKQVQHLNDLEPFIVSGSLPSHVLAALPHILLGTLHTKYKPMCDVAVKLIKLYCGRFFTQLWPSLWDKVQSIDSIMDAQVAAAAAGEYVSGTGSAVHAAPVSGHGNKRRKASSIVSKKSVPRKKEETDWRGTVLELELAKGDSCQLREGLFAADVKRQSCQYGAVDGCVLPIVYNSFLWDAMLEIAGHLEGKTKQIVPLFIKFLQKQYGPIFWSGLPWKELFTDYNQRKAGKSDCDGDCTMEGADDEVQELTKAELDGWTKGEVRQRLRAALLLLAKFPNPRGVCEAELLLEVYRFLLAYSDSGIQMSVLRCLAVWKFDYLSPYMESLERLVDDKSFREELALFSIDPELSDVVAVQEKHRNGLIPVLTLILFSKMMSKSSKVSLHARRNAVLAYLCGFRPEELGLFMKLMLRPFAGVVASFEGAKMITLEEAEEGNKSAAKKRKRKGKSSGELGSIVFGRGIHEMVAKIPSNKKLGFVFMMRDMLKQLGGHMDRFLPQLLGLLLAVLEGALMDENSTRSSKLQTEAIHRLAAVLEAFPSYEYSAWLSPQFFETLEPLVVLMPRHISSSAPALLGLFLAMSKRQETLWMLTSKPSTLPSAIKCFSTPDLPGKFVMQLLTFVESLQRRSEEEGAEDLLKPHVDLLLEHMRHLGIRSLTSGHTRRHLAVLSNLSRHATDGRQASAILEMLVPFLEPGHRIDAAGRVEVLKIYENFAGILEHPLRHGRVLASQFRVVREKEVREQLVSLYKALSVPVPALAAAATTLEGLNAFSSTMISEYDYDTRLAGYRGLNKLLDETTGSKDALPVHALLPLACNCLYFLPDEDTSIRESACDSLKRIVRYISANFPEEETMSSEERELNGGMPGLEVVTHFIMPVIRRSIRLLKKECRTEHLQLLSAIVVAFPRLYSDLRQLAAERDAAEEDEGDHGMGEETEVAPDFFVQLSLISNAAKMAAVQRLRYLLAPPAEEEREPAFFKTGTLTDILVPLLGFHVLSKPTKNAADNNLADECVRCIGVIAARLPWGRYQAVLTRFMLAIESSPAATKRLIRLCCEIIDNFHFDIRTGLPLAPTTEEPMEVDSGGEEDSDSDDGEEGGSGDSAGDSDQDEDNEEEEEVEEDDDEEEKDEESASTTEKDVNDGAKVETAEEEVKQKEEEHAEGLSMIESAIVKRIIPQFHKYLKVDKSLVALCVQVSHAIVKLIRLLPEEKQGPQLRQLLGRLVATLRSRDQQERDDTRATLQQVVSVIGPRYFGFVLKELKSQLSKGYQLQVLGFTLHALLYHLRPSMAAGDLDDCAEELATTLIEDIVGEAGQKKQVKAIQGAMKESRTVKSFDSIEILAECITFQTHVRSILYPVHGILTATVSLTLVKQMEEILRRTSVGLTRNTSMRPQDLLLLIYHVVSGNLEFYHGEMRLGRTQNDVEKGDGEEEDVSSAERLRRLHARPKSAYLVPDAPRVAANKAKVQQSGIVANLHIMAEFALGLFHACLKRNVFDLADDEQMAMLEPFVRLLLGCLSSAHSKTMIMALKDLCFLIRFRLPSVEELGPNITTRVFKLLKKSSAKTGGLMQACFKTMVVVIRDCKTIKLTDSQLRHLLGLIDMELDHLERSALTFSMLKAIVGKRLVVPELYDMMNRVSQLMVTSHTTAVREQCGQIFTNFLIFYPLGEKRLEQHLRFIVRNLSYHTESGRESVLSLLAGIIDRFPEAIVNAQGEMFFLALVLRLVNDDSQSCKRMAATVVKGLFTRCSPVVTGRLFALTVRWYVDGSKVAMQWAAAQVLGLFVEAVGQRSLQKMEGLLPAMVGVVEEAVRREEESKLSVFVEEETMDEEEHSEAWKPMYFTLTALEKLFREKGDLFEDSRLDGLWEPLQRAMLHSHMWPRTAANRLLGLAFSRTKPQRMEVDGKVPFLVRPGVLFSLACNTCSQLYSKLLTREAANQAVKNLVFITQALFSHQHLAGPLRGLEADPEEERDMDDAEKLPSKKQQARPHVHWIFRRLSFMARRAGAYQAETSTAIFRFFAAMCVSLKPKQVALFLVPIISPLYRAVEHQEDGPVKELAAEVLDLLKQRVSTESFASAYNEVRKSVATSRIQRKRKLALEAVLEPEKHAANKQRRNLRKRESRKRKLDSYKPNRNSIKVSYQ